MPVWRATVDAQQWRETALQVRGRGGRLVALWASDETNRAGGYVVHAALCVRDGLLWLTLPMALQPPEFPDLAGIFPDADRMQRAALRPGRRACRRCPGSTPLAAARRLAEGHVSAAQGLRCAARIARAAGQLRFRPGHRGRCARNPGRARACGHHRAGSLPLLGGGRACAAARGASRVHAQGRREALRVARRAGGGPPGRAHQRRFDRGLRLGLRDGGRECSRPDTAGPLPLAARAVPGARAHRQPPGRSGLPRQRRGPGLRPRPDVAPEGGGAAAERHPLRPPLPDGCDRAGRCSVRRGSAMACGRCTPRTRCCARRSPASE